MNILPRRSALLLLTCAAVLALGAGCADEAVPEQGADSVPVPEGVVIPEPEPVPIVCESRATIGAMGDVLMHVPVIKTGTVDEGGNYDFADMFPYLSPYVEGVDYAAANLETTLCGTENGYPYRGYPRFNCPDGIVPSLKDAGFDLLLTANNHTFDTGEIGFFRTLNVVDEAGLDRIGTHAAPEEKRYLVEEINGIKVGMLCYTYETQEDPAAKALNGLPLTEQVAGLVNTFHEAHLEDFYTELKGHLTAMEEEGAQATVLFIHWGVEYQTRENQLQQTMAQAICDLGVDVIIGGHPHVVQPVELFQSTLDPTHRTVCLYSMGNAVSNQRISEIPSAKGHTEDGLFFQVTFAAYTDGTVLLEGVEALPTWVNLTKNDETGRRVYEILPLDEEVEDWQTAFGLTDEELDRARSSYDRTMAIVGEGMEGVERYLAEQEIPSGFLEE